MISIPENFPILNKGTNRGVYLGIHHDGMCKSSDENFMIISFRLGLTTSSASSTGKAGIPLRYMQVIQ